MRTTITIAALFACLAFAGTSFAGNFGVDKNGKTVSKACDGSTVVIISGNKNTVTLTGTCAQVLVDGNGNKISINGVGTLKIQGNKNSITWKSGVGKKAPSVSNLGKGNSIRKVK